MRILHLVINCPWPPRSGGDIRNSAIATALSHSPYLCLGLGGECSNAFNYQTLQAFRNTNPWKACEPSCPTTIQFPDSALDEIRRACRNHRADTVVLEGIAFAPLLDAGVFADQRVILDMHNIESHLYTQKLTTARLWRRMRSWPQRRNTQRATEKADAMYSQKVNQTWVCSQADAERLRSLGGRHTRIIPNPIPMNESFEIAVHSARYKSAIPLFVGHLGYFPNVQAVKQLVAGAKGLRSTVTVTPTVAGRSPSKIIYRLAKRGRIRLLENPDQIGPLLAEHGYTLLPIKHGSGTRIKVLEALAAGLVVIATPQAVEGLELQEGKHYLAANQSNEMFAAMRWLVANPAKAMQVAKQGREFAKAHYSLNEVVERVRSSLAEAICSKRN